jgi:hypothetical protein
MPLTRASTTPLVDTWGVYFNMLSPHRLSVQCTVAHRALDVLVKGDGNTTEGEQIAIFTQWRDAIESLASQKYDVGKVDHHGMVIVGPDDVIVLRTLPHDLK